MKARSLCAVSLALFAAPAIAKVVPIPAATPDGALVGCLPVTGIRETRVRSDRVIDFYMRGGKVYRNTLPNSCPRLGFEQSFTYRVYNGQLCSVDVVRVFNRAVPMVGPGCLLGQFQPVAGIRR